MYIDIHVHNEYELKDVVLLLNLFPGDSGKVKMDKFYSIGLHPWHVNDATLEHDISTISVASENKNILAVGEIGLDKNIDVPYISQLRAFELQLEIAEKFMKPVIIHCVKAYDDMLSIRKKSDQSLPWIFHWFNASWQIATELLKYNCYLSFGKMLFKENSRAFDVFKSMPLERVFFETDDTGIIIPEVYKKAALARNVSLQILEEIIARNFADVFGELI